jgi:hypothetical protein
MNTTMDPARLGAYRRTFAGVRTPELRAIVEGKRPTGLSAEALTAIRLLLEERASGLSAAVLPPEPAGLRQDSSFGLNAPLAGAPGTVEETPPDPCQSWQRAPRTNRRWLVGLGAAFTVVIGVLALPATRDELAWLRVSEDESTADEQAYLEAWPAGRHAAEARARLDRHAWSAAVGLDSVKSYQSYLEAFPGGEQAAEAQARVEALKWDAALAARDIRPLKTFLREHPASPHAGEARLHIDDLTRQQALEAAQRVRQIRSRLADIYVMEGARGDASGRDWANACPSLNMAVEDRLAPGARIHLAAGLIQDSVAIPDNVQLICGYGRNAQGAAEHNPRLHRVWLMPPAKGVRTLTLGQGCKLSGLWLGMLWIHAGDRIWTCCDSIEGSGKVELGNIGFKVESDGAMKMENYDPGLRQFRDFIRGTGKAGIGVTDAQAPPRLVQPPF